MTVLVVGESLVDVVSHDGHDDEVLPGGSPFNVAVGLARLGVEVELATHIGDDTHGALLNTALDDAGVRRSSGARSGTSSSARAFVQADGSARYDLDVTWDPGSLPDPAAFEAVAVGSLGTFLEPGASQVAELALSADALGVPVAFDPNVRTSVDGDADHWRAAFARVVPHARIVKLSDEDAAILHPDVSASDLARRLASEGALVAVTQGMGGSLIAHRDRLVIVQAPTVDVADTIGAGDSYMAAMLAWCAMYRWPDPDELDVAELHDLGEYAARAAGITVSRPGADPPHVDEL